MMPRLIATAIFTLSFLEANAKPSEDGRSLWEYQFKKLCEREGAPMPMDGMHVDHFFPYNKGGAYHPWNFWPTSPQYNILKSDSFSLSICVTRGIEACARALAVSVAEGNGEHRISLDQLLASFTDAGPAFNTRAARGHVEYLREEVPRLIERGIPTISEWLADPKNVAAACKGGIERMNSVGAIIDVLRKLTPMEKGGKILGKQWQFKKASDFFAAAIDKPGVTSEKAVENAKKVLRGVAKKQCGSLDITCNLVETFKKMSLDDAWDFSRFSEGGQPTREPTAEPASGGHSGDGSGSGSSSGSGSGSKWSRWCDFDGDGDCDAEFRLVTNFAYALNYVTSRFCDAPNAAGGVTSPAVANWRKAYNVIAATRAFEQAGRGA